RPLLVHGVELLGLLLGDAHPLLRDNAQAGLFDNRVDRAGQVALGRIGFEDGEGTLARHGKHLSRKSIGRMTDPNWGGFSRRLILEACEPRQGTLEETPGSRNKA